jgi:hypothetical protein
MGCGDPLSVVTCYAVELREGRKYAVERILVVGNVERSEQWSKGWLFQNGYTELG